MNKITGIGILFLLLLTTYACGSNTSLVEVTLVFNEPVQDVVLESDLQLEETWLSDTEVRISGLAVNQEISLLHSVATFDPAVFNVGKDLETVHITVIWSTVDEGLTETDTDDAGDNIDEDPADDDPIDDDSIDEDPIDDDFIDDDATDDDTTDDEEDLFDDRSQTVSVATVNELEAALDEISTGTIVYTNDLSGNITLHGAINLDLGGFTHNGDLEIATQEKGTVVFENGYLDGDLVVDGENITFTNYLTVSGDIFINAVATQSFYEEATGNTIIVFADMSLIEINNEATKVFIKASNISLVLNAPVSMVETSSNLTDVTIIGAQYIQQAIIMSETVSMDGLPGALEGDFLPIFDKPIMDSIMLPSLDALPYGATLETLENNLPTEITITTLDGDSFIVTVEGYNLMSAFDEDTIETQLMVFELILDIPEEVINAKFLVPEITIEIRSVRDSFSPIDFIYDENDIEFEYGEVDGLEAIIDDHLPSMLWVSLNGGWNWASIEAEWTLVSGTFDPETFDETVLVFSGMVTEAPEGYHILDAVPIEVTVTILERDEDYWVEEPYGDIHIQTQYPDAITWTIEEEVVEHTRHIYVTFDVNEDYRIDALEYYQTGYQVTADLPTHQFNRSTTSTTPLEIIVRATKLERPEFGDIYSSGTGTISNPFVITNHEELQNMKYYLDGNRHFILGNDIIIPEDFDFEPMSTPNPYKPFSGSFNGQGHKIIGYRVVNDQPTGFNYSSFIDRSYGTIENIIFEDVYHIIESNSSYDGIVTRFNGGTIRNVTVTGYREGKGNGLVGQNAGLIDNVIVDMTMKNANAGIAYINHGTLTNSTVTISTLITKQNIGRIAGVVGSNTTQSHIFGEISDGHISNVNATVLIQIDLDSVSGDSGLDIGGFAFSNSGTSTHDDQVQAGIYSSGVNVEIRMLGAYRVGNIGGFVSENIGGGYIYDSSAIGVVEGNHYIGGFVAQNRGGILPGELDKVFADVDVYASSNTAGGLVALNHGTSYSISAIVRDSEARGNVYGTTSKGSLVGSNSGRIFDSEGFGNVFDYIED